MFEELKVGTVQVFQRIVAKEEASLQYGSGVHKNLLATPSLVAFMIECTIKMVDPKLPKWYVSVGKNISVEHLAATAKGVTVTIEATLTKVDGNHFHFDIKAYDELGVIATGTHERYIVQYDRFMDKVEERCRVLTNENLRVEL